MNLIKLWTVLLLLTSLITINVFSKGNMPATTNSQTSVSSVSPEFSLENLKGGDQVNLSDFA